MKKIFVTLMLFSSLVSYSQTKKEYSEPIEIVTKIINQHISFLSYRIINDTLKVEQIVYYDFNKKIYINLSKKDISNLYPELLIGIAIKSNIPHSSSNGRNINNLNCINTLNFFNWTYFTIKIRNIRTQSSPREIFA